MYKRLTSSSILCSQQQQQQGDTDDSMNENDYQSWLLSALNRLQYFVLKLSTKRNNCYGKLSSTKTQSEEHPCDVQRSRRVSKQPDDVLREATSHLVGQYQRDDRHFKTAKGVVLDGSQVKLELPKNMTENERLHLIRTRFQRRNGMQVSDPDILQKQLFDYVTLKNLLRYTNLSIPVRTGDFLTSCDSCG